MRINIIYMAAGNSRRFGSNKLLYPLDGKALYRHGLEHLLVAAKNHPDWKIFVVTQYEEILARAYNSENLYAVESPQSIYGISHTIRAGIAFAEQAASDSAGYAFFTADQPYLSTETMERFLKEMEQAPAGVLGSLHFSGQPGNPTYFSRVYLPELLALTGDTGGRKILKKYPERICWVQAERERELLDIDTPEK